MLLSRMPSSRPLSKAKPMPPKLLFKSLTNINIQPLNIIKYLNALCFFSHQIYFRVYIVLSPLWLTQGLKAFSALARSRCSQMFNFRGGGR